ncbi:hypothetical protein BBP40_000433 [Aspergillus hancockii]|nr:hypothetical protein BBP40_000433 [Aspergillus hancockii]
MPNSSSQPFDPTLPYLASIGGGEMWREQPSSEREGFEQGTVEPPDGANRSGQGGKQPGRVGAAIVRESQPSYLTAREELRIEIDKCRKLLFMEIVSDFRTGPPRKGAGEERW